MSARPIRGPYDLDGELRLELSQFQQDNRQVVNKQKSVHERHGVLYYPLVIPLRRRQDTDGVKEPVGDHQQEYEDHDQSSEDENPREESFGATEEKCPAPNEEDEEFEGHGDK